MKHVIFLLAALMLLMTACKKEFHKPPQNNKYNPDIRPERFTNSTNITNPWSPFELGKKYISEGETEDGLEHIEEQRLNTTKKILGITCIVVDFKAYVDGILIEEAFDWYAQDNDGTLWYFGEAVDNYNSDGTLKDHAGSWEAGVDGAQPGIIMLAKPKAGLTYREEFYLNYAEDEAEVLETGLTVIIPLGTFKDCIKTRNFTRLEPDLQELKYYAPGYGIIKEVNLTDSAETLLKSIQ